MTITKEKNGKWKLTDRIKCSDGEYHCMTVRGYSKKSDAQADYQNQRLQFLRRFDQKNDNLIKYITNEDKFTLNSVVEEYLEYFKSKNKLSTYIGVEGKIKRNILDIFPNNNINVIFNEDSIREWKKTIINNGTTIFNRNTIISHMRRLIERAMKREILDYKIGNRCLLMLDSHKEDIIIDKSISFWTPDEYLRFINSFPPTDKYRIVFETFYYCGLRCGELAGLQWKHFDIPNKQLHIKQQANNKLRTGKAEITTPKTKNAVRDIDLNDEFYKELILYKEFAYNGDDNEFIFFGKSPISPTSIRRVLDKHIGIACVKHIRIHDLRHSHASLLISLGADPFYIMKRLGHASYEETTNTYGHLFPNVARSIVQQLNTIVIKEREILTLE